MDMSGSLLKGLIRFFARLGDRLWWALPLSKRKKEDLKTAVFTRFEFAFRGSAAYNNWKSGQFNSIIHADTRVGKSLEDRTPKPDTEWSVGERVEHLVIVLHAFYMDVFQEMIQHLVRSKKAWSSLYVSSPPEKKAEVSEILNAHELSFHYLPTENRGRDIWPFLQVLKRIQYDNNLAVLKLHTKKSNHLRTGDLWRRDIYAKLLGKKNIEQTIHLLNEYLSIGVVGPSDHVVPMNLYYGANADQLKKLSALMGVHMEDLYRLQFVAGTMFYARLEALKPLLSLNLGEEDFEAEEGQLDGTMAHALERAIAVSAWAAKFKLVDTGYRTNRKTRIAYDHRFSR